MVNQPTPAALARNLRQLADRLDDQGDRAIRQAAVLAARGWPKSVVGDGRGGTTASSTEHAATHPGPYDDIDNRFARQLRLLWVTILHTHATLDTIMSQASDDDPVPPGTGRCLRCDKFVRPDGKRPHNRIQAGYCPACYRKWVRLGRPDRSTFARNNQQDVA
ncbi:MAG: hypothetical protein ACRDX9_02070 [Acidimicrobiia bacterium]